MKKLFGSYKLTLAILGLMIVGVFVANYFSFFGGPSLGCVQREFSSLNMATFGVRDPKKPHVLVLGSGGLVGSSLTAALRKQGHEVLEVKGRQHLDLREENSLAIFDSLEISFVYFLACEVGGAKFLKLPHVQEAVWESNIKMYDNVFGYLEKRKIPFIFSSSQLSNQPTNYGKVKKLGEDFVNKMPLGKNLQFWNVFGEEPIGLKSHVISDWVHSCLTKGKVDSLTDGTEVRQFLHTEDCSQALISMMKNFDSLDKMTSLTNGVWSDLQSVATIVKTIVPTCEINFSTGKSNVMKGQDPNMNGALHKFWKPQMSLEDGIRRVHDIYSSRLTENNFVKPYLSFIVYDQNAAQNQKIVQEMEDWTAAFSKYHESYKDLFEVLVVLPGRIQNHRAGWIKPVVIDSAYVPHMALNRAMEQAMGDYVVLIESKTIPTEMMMENLRAKKLRQNAYYVSQYVDVSIMKEEYLKKQEIPVGTFTGRRVSHNFVNCSNVLSDYTQLTETFLMSHKDNFLAIGGYHDSDGKPLESHLLTSTKLVNVFPGLDRVVLEDRVFRVMSPAQKDALVSAELTPDFRKLQSATCCHDSSSVYWGSGDTQLRFFENLRTTTSETPACKAPAPSVSFNDVTFVSMVDSSHLSDIRNLIGGIHFYYPGRRIVLYHYGLPQKHISEVNIMRDVALVDLSPRMKSGNYEQQSMIALLDAVNHNSHVMFFSAMTGLESAGLDQLMSVYESQKQQVFLSVDSAFVIMMSRKSPLYSQLNTHVSCLLSKYAKKDVTEPSECPAIPISYAPGAKYGLAHGKGPGKCYLQHIYRYPSTKSEGLTTDTRPRICMGIPSLTRKATPINELPIMNTLLKSDSFPASVRKEKDSDYKFFYSFYIGYDEGDPTYDSPMLAEFQAEFRKRVEGIPADLHFSRYPPVMGDNVYIWNHVMMQAYVDGCDYLYQLCDDINIISAGWSEGFTENLAKYDPPNVGMTGFPVFSTLVSQPFVHRTHMEIFGNFYPPIFKNWYGDTWLTSVYGGRSNWDARFQVANTQIAGMRYENCPHSGEYEQEKLKGKDAINAYLNPKGKSW